METTCPQCQRVFALRPCDVRKGKRFCSRACYDKSRDAQPKADRQCVCRQCGETFHPHPSSPGIYCSYRCRAAFQKGEHHNRYQGGQVTLTCEQCGREFSVYPSRTRRKSPAKLCSKACTALYQRGPNAPGWKGGRFLDPQGYVVVYAPNHPRAFNNHVYEHILVAEATLGRSLMPGEEVHHDDEVRDNNDPSNLIVLTTSEHQKLHRAREKQKRLIQSNTAT